MILITTINKQILLQLIHFQSLKMLEVTGGSLDTIPVFSRIPNLNIIFLNQNKITRIPSMAFANLPELVVRISDVLISLPRQKLNIGYPKPKPHNNKIQ